MNNNENCSCKRTKCERHGDCDACRLHHTNDKKNVPACDRIKKKLEHNKKERNSSLLNVKKSV